MQLRRLSDRVLEWRLIEVQLGMIHELESQSQAAHGRVAVCQARLNDVEREVRMRARELGEDARGEFGVLQRRLAAFSGRRRRVDPGYRGSERRQGLRRRSDQR